jgi:hypothetical protein
VQAEGEEEHAGSAVARRQWSRSAREEDRIEAPIVTASSASNRTNARVSLRERADALRGPTPVIRGGDPPERARILLNALV